MFDPTQLAQQIGPQQQVLRGLIKSAERPTIGPRPPNVHTVIRITGYLIGAKLWVFIGQLWYKIHWILQARATNTILNGCIPVILFLYSERIQHRSKTKVWLTGVQGCEPLSWQAKYKNGFLILFIFRYSVPCWFSESYCFLGVFGNFWTVIFWWFWVSVYRNPLPDTLSFLNFFLNVGEGPPTVASGPLSATFSGLAKCSSYATGLQLIFPE